MLETAKSLRRNIAVLCVGRRSTARLKADEAEKVAKKAIEDAQRAKEHARLYDENLPPVTTTTTNDTDNDTDSGTT